MEIKEQSINAEESKFYKKILDSLGIVYEIEEIKKMFLSMSYLKNWTLEQIIP